MLNRLLRACVPLAALAMVGSAAAQDTKPDDQPVVQTEMGAQVEQFLNQPMTVSGQTLAMTPGDIFTWVFVGVLAGTLAAVVFTRRESGFGHLANLGVGLLGALIGGFVLSVLPFRVDMGALTIGVNELAASFAGSIVLLVFTMWLGAASRGRAKKGQPGAQGKPKPEQHQRRRAA
ncbi:MAG: GlsB/YeaQ/YmgE family stress response membrane protein [Phycisphaerales bacterium JB039]